MEKQSSVSQMSCVIPNVSIKKITCNMIKMSIFALDSDLIGKKKTQNIQYQTKLLTTQIRTYI